MPDPQWFLAKIAAGLEAAGVPLEASAPAPKLSRSEIDSIVTATLDEEIARLKSPRLGQSPPRPPLKD